MMAANNVDNVAAPGPLADQPVAQEPGGTLDDLELEALVQIDDLCGEVAMVRRRSPPSAFRGTCAYAHMRRPPCHSRMEHRLL